MPKYLAIIANQSELVSPAHDVNPISPGMKAIRKEKEHAEKLWSKFKNNILADISFIIRYHIELCNKIETLKKNKPEEFYALYKDLNTNQYISRIAFLILEDFTREKQLNYVATCHYLFNKVVFERILKKIEVNKKEFIIYLYFSFIEKFNTFREVDLLNIKNLSLEQNMDSIKNLERFILEKSQIYFGDFRTMFQEIIDMYYYSLKNVRFSNIFLMVAARVIYIVPEYSLLSKDKNINWQQSIEKISIMFNDLADQVKKNRSVNQHIYEDLFFKYRKIIGHPTIIFENDDILNTYLTSSYYYQALTHINQALNNNNEKNKSLRIISILDNFIYKKIIPDFEFYIELIKLLANSNISPEVYDVSFAIFIYKYKNELLKSGNKNGYAALTEIQAIYLPLDHSDILFHYLLEMVSVGINDRWLVDILIDFLNSFDCDTKITQLLLCIVRNNRAVFFENFLENDEQKKWIGNNKATLKKLILEYACKEFVICFFSLNLSNKLNIFDNNYIIDCIYKFPDISIYDLIELETYQQYFLEKIYASFEHNHDFLFKLLLNSLVNNKNNTNIELIELKIINIANYIDRKKNIIMVYISKIKDGVIIYNKSYLDSILSLYKKNNKLSNVLNNEDIDHIAALDCQLQIKIIKCILDIESPDHILKSVYCNLLFSWLQKMSLALLKSNFDLIFNILTFSDFNTDRNKDNFLELLRSKQEQKLIFLLDKIPELFFTKYKNNYPIEYVSDYNAATTSFGYNILNDLLDKLLDKYKDKPLHEQLIYILNNSQKINYKKILDFIVNNNLVDDIFLFITPEIKYKYIKSNNLSIDIAKKIASSCRTEISYYLSKAQVKNDYEFIEKLLSIAKHIINIDIDIACFTDLFKIIAISNISAEIKISILEILQKNSPEKFSLLLEMDIIEYNKIIQNLYHYFKHITFSKLSPQAYCKLLNNLLPQQFNSLTAEIYDNGIKAAYQLQDFTLLKKILVTTNISINFSDKNLNLHCITIYLQINKRDFAINYLKKLSVNEILDNKTMDILFLLNHIEFFNVIDNIINIHHVLDFLINNQAQNYLRRLIIEWGVEINSAKIYYAVAMLHHDDIKNIISNNINIEHLHKIIIALCEQKDCKIKLQLLLQNNLSANLVHRILMIIYNRNFMHNNSHYKKINFESKLTLANIIDIAKNTNAYEFLLINFTSVIAKILLKNTDAHNLHDWLISMLLDEQLDMYHMVKLINIFIDDDLYNKLYKNVTTKKLLNLFHARWYKFLTIIMPHLPQNLLHEFFANTIVNINFNNNLNLGSDIIMPCPLQQWQILINRHINNNNLLNYALNFEDFTEKHQYYIKNLLDFAEVLNSKLLGVGSTGGWLILKKLAIDLAAKKNLDKLLDTDFDGRIVVADDFVITAIIEMPLMQILQNIADERGVNLTYNLARDVSSITFNFGMECNLVIIKKSWHKLPEDVFPSTVLNINKLYINKSEKHIFITAQILPEKFLNSLGTYFKFLDLNDERYSYYNLLSHIQQTSAVAINKWAFFAKKIAQFYFANLTLTDDDKLLVKKFFSSNIAIKAILSRLFSKYNPTNHNADILRNGLDLCFVDLKINIKCHEIGYIQNANILQFPYLASINSDLTNNNITAWAETIYFLWKNNSTISLENDILQIFSENFMDDANKQKLFSALQSYINQLSAPKLKHSLASFAQQFINNHAINKRLKFS